MGKDYFIGLDMGTSSVGWAVTDMQYHLLRAKGKDLWGVRLFPEANTAAERRANRVSRRRLQRRKTKIHILQEIFSEEINKIDPGFFQRLEDSKFLQEDKRIKQPFALFADTGFTDCDYYEKYPTIFHLRKELIESEEPKDIRLVYLAILNIFKHRGHFLNASLSGEGVGHLADLYEELVEQTERFPKQADLDTVEQILSSKKVTNSRRFEQLLQVFSLSKKDPEAEMLKLICGLKGTLSKALPDEPWEEEKLKYSVSFRDSNYEEKETEIVSMLSAEGFELIGLLKSIHDWGVLSGIMQGEKYLSCARVKAYEKHADDLNRLKTVYKEYSNGAYNQMFRVMEANNYSSYVGSVNSEKTQGKVRRGAKCKPEDFFKRLKRDVENMAKSHPEDVNLQYILEELGKDTFLPLQLTASNGVIPNQVHLVELKRILKNAEEYLPFLSERDDTGLSNSEKIQELFSFCIPYYVGPLYNSETNTAWVSRLEPGKVYPWNFEQKVDIKKTSEEFIQRMVRQCTYISNENVLPKCSLLYERFMVLNELNNLKINGERVTARLKQDIYKALFRKEKKVTAKKLINYLRCCGYIGKNEEVSISGIDGDFTNTLSNYQKFANIFDTEILSYDQEKMAEQIIFWATVYGDSRKFLRDRIEEAYGNLLSEAQIKRILGIKFRDWGRLSKSFLYLEGADTETGEVKTIIARMWDESLNLMECLSDRFTYVNELASKQKAIQGAFDQLRYEDLDDLYLSAPVKRMVWQTILVVREIVQVLGCPPKRVFIEMARDVDGKNEKARKDSRKKKFSDLYKKCKEEGRDWAKEIEETEEARFRSKKLYLYYTQKGRCMYTGEPIDLADLFNDNLYDIDHIYPRHFVKDDSIEKNLVLVKKEINNHKSDTYPLEASIQKTMHSWWSSLQTGGFITKEKYERLIRRTGFTLEEQAAFISRQIVETRQGTKTIAQLFKKSFEDTEIVYSKAGNVSDFRHKFDLIKCREINDYHHANDAYLNIVVGNVFHVKFTSNPIVFVKEYQKDPEKYAYHMDKMFEFPVSRGTENAWITRKGESIKTVCQIMKKNSPLVTRMNYEVHGGLADQTIYSAEDARKAKGKGYIPVKTTDERLQDVTKYGGFKKYTGAYFFLVEHTLKGKRVRSLDAMPLYLLHQLDTTEKMEEYCKDYLKYVDPVIRLKKIKMYSLIKVDGFFLYLTGRSNNSLFVSNAVELSMDYKWQNYIKRILQIVDGNQENSSWNEKSGITKEKNNLLYDILVQKHCKEIYSKRPNSISKVLCNGKEQFELLSLSEQIYVLTQVLQISGAGNRGADLKKIGGVEKTGVAMLNKKISIYEEFKLINQSPTGLYRLETDLLRV